MSACCQAKAARRKMRNGHAHMSGSLKRPRSSALSRAEARANAAIKKK